MVESARQFAKFAVETTFNDLPPAVVEEAKRCILDTLGCALGSFSSKTIKILIDFVKSNQGKAESTVWKGGFKASQFWAAFANACGAHDLELDDGHVLAHSHPGVTIIPPAIAIGETVGSTGKDLITSTVLGYELNVRLGKAVTPSALYDRGFHPPGIVGSYSAATATGKLLGLSEDMMTNALGIACLGPLATMETFEKGSMTKDAYAGWPAAVGTMAAQLAQRGFTGTSSIFEGKSGFCHAVANDYSAETITERLGQEWEILSIYRKRHAMCSHGHTTMDAALDILERNHPNLDEIQNINVRTYAFAAGLSNPEPNSAIAAKFSIPYCVAVVLAKGGPVGPLDFEDSTLSDPKTLGLSRKVKMILDHDVDEYHKAHEEHRRTIVELLMNNGTKYASSVDIAKGWPTKSLTGREVEEKFRTLASVSLNNEKIDAILNTVRTLEKAKNLTGLINLLQ